MSASSPMHEFLAPVLYDPDVAPGYMKHFLPIPEPVARALAGQKRLIGSVNGIRFRRVAHQRDDGSACLKFGESWLKEAGLSDGNEVRVTLGPDPDPDAVDVPDALRAALEDAPEAALVWLSLTPGRQRTLAYGVGRAKRAQTRRRRAAAVVAELLT